MVAARIVGGVDQIEAGLIDRDGVERGKDADVRHARVLGHGAAVAVHGHILHNVDENGLVLEIFRHGRGGVRHRVEEAVVVGSPDLFGLAGTVDIGLAVGRRAADGELLERAAEAAHRMPLEVGEDEHGIVVGNVLADEVLLNAPAVRNGKLQIGALGIENVHVEIRAPAVLDHRAAVLLGGVALALVGGVALNHRAMHGLDHRPPEVGTQKVLVALLTGVQLHGDLARQLAAHGAVKRHDLLGRDLTGEAYLSFHRVFLLARKINICIITHCAKYCNSRRNGTGLRREHVTDVSKNGEKCCADILKFQKNDVCD